MGVQDREWYWEERLRKEKLYYKPRAFRRAATLVPASGSETPRRIVGPVVVTACVVAAALTFMANRHGEHAIVAPQSQAAKHARETQQFDAEATAESARRQQERLAALQQQELRRLQEIAARRERESSASALAAGAEERRKAAWARFYQSSPKCEGGGTVECANEFIRARRKFEAQYSANNR
jgi:hypothetical protein